MLTKVPGTPLIGAMPVILGVLESATLLNVSFKDFTSQTNKYLNLPLIEHCSEWNSIGRKGSDFP